MADKLTKNSEIHMTPQGYEETKLGTPQGGLCGAPHKPPCMIRKNAEFILSSIQKRYKAIKTFK
jgi:hypothetical protein